jgi:tRNA-splicing ligase RtcB
VEQISKKLMNWASILEPNTREQAERTASMPFIHPHLALMPDAHLGKGATVGSVIPTLGAIIPAAVGVDIGCVDADTEFLSPTGWKRIADYAGEPVMGYDPASGLGEFVQPLQFVKRPSSGFWHFKTKYGIDQKLSPDHRVLGYKIVGRDRRREQVVVSAAELAKKHAWLKLGAKFEFITTFTPLRSVSLPLTDPEIRVMVMVMADGAFNSHREHSTRVTLRFKKERKIARSVELLDAAAIEYSKRQTSDGATAISFDAPMRTKTYQDFWNASLDQITVIADEVLHWDGHLPDRVFFTRDERSADFIQYVFTATGRRAVKRADVHPDGKTDYRVFAHERIAVGLAGAPKSPVQWVESTDGHEYCFTMPSGFWVMRRGGNVVMTGNCGMIAVRTQYVLGDLDGLDRSALRESIEQAIPLSAGNYNQHVTNSAEPRVVALADDARKARFDPTSYAGNWDLQLGTLGSGNHFIEVTVDESDQVWLFLHSGSRGIGNKIAQRHIKIAKSLCEKWWIPLPDPDLAYLVEGTDEFWTYIRELRWAQKFALYNREEMMDRVVQCFEEWLGNDVDERERINCHHNFTQKERHWGKDVWVSRKGAISAKTGELGLIPGSMGTASYVVEGLGNRLSLDSSPHGAGRNYSRSKARKAFTHDQLRERMAGIEWRDSEAFLDEIPDAYKPVEQVMADAIDLVNTKHVLHQIINVKGE